ncbi:hypothetical protein E2C01_089464 [Portunus trituberculatus]|uniref:Uncharacterized protein n=1 Tax=Portunus trituberculatus TaxID=210409 RepID=A0A5B7JC25_PORTR|nr:hypothetical protein [Portunus trituberculatus]
MVVGERKGMMGKDSGVMDDKTEITASHTFATSINATLLPLLPLPSAGTRSLANKTLRCQFPHVLGNPLMLEDKTPAGGSVPAS